MRYIDEFRDKNLIRSLAQRINQVMPQQPINLMEVCGTHTMSFHRFGLKRLLPSHLRLVSGPGCPVCVSDENYIDKAVAYSKIKDVIIVTFADMLRVPGSRSSLEKQRARGSDVRIVYSAWDTLRIACDNPKKTVIFLSVGFETTAPTIALSLQEARRKNLKNLLFFSSLKLIPAAMDYLLKDKRLNIQGFLCPGHVSTIIGVKSYEFIPKKYGIACCIAGFEPLDIMQGIYVLLRQIRQDRPEVINQYMRLVKRQGNKKAQAVIKKAFKITDTKWRGIGCVPKSGLKLKNEFFRFDVEKVMPLKLRGELKDKRLKLCRCGDVLKGIIQPLECPLFAKSCKPQSPQGPCMVSSEGTCHAYYKYQ